MTQEKIIRIGDRGRFERKRSEFRDQVTADGSSGFPVEADRYHLYIAWACPWAHRTLLHRDLLGLQDAIGVSVVHWLMDDEGGWNFAPEEGYTDDVGGQASMQDVYHKADAGFEGAGTVPVLWDKKEGTIVNNESREIIRMLDTEFRDLQTNDITFLPEGQEAEVDAMIDANYESVNNGVYKSGFARTQEAYEEAVTALFDRLDGLEAHLGKQRYLVGEHITEADWCLFTTLVRFDLVYHYHFKCNIRRIADYPNLWDYTRELYQVPGVKETMDLDDTKKHYFGSHTSINPYRIIPMGPEVALEAPHTRDERLPVEKRFARFAR